MSFQTDAESSLSGWLKTSRQQFDGLRALFSKHQIEKQIDFDCNFFLELWSADASTKMNILEDYISWGWDVTKGEQSWEPFVSKTNIRSQNRTFYMGARS